MKQFLRQFLILLLCCFATTQTHAQGINIFFNDGTSQYFDDANILRIEFTDAPSPSLWTTDGAEDYEAFSYQHVGDWLMVDGDGSKTYGIQNYTFPNQQAAMAYIVFNTSQVENLVSNKWDPYEGKQMFCSFAAMTPPNNDWLISPLLCGEAQQISFWAKSMTAEYGEEEFQVWATNDQSSNILDYKMLSQGTISVGEKWTKFSFDLPSGTQHFAIRCVSNDRFVFCVDNITFKRAAGGHTPVAKPEITSSDYSRVTYNSAVLQATATNVASGSVCGFVYNTEGQPDSEANRSECTINADGSFTTTITGLSAKTAYYFRPFVYFDGNYYYGAEKSFSTLEAPYLDVSENSIDIDDAKGATTSFNITSNSNWIISNVPEWLTLSENSGSGDATITITTNSVNTTSDVRTAYLMVSGANTTKYISVKQAPSIAENCFAEVTISAVLSNSVIADLVHSDNSNTWIAYNFRASEIEGLTDNQIISKLEEAVDFRSPSDHEYGDLISSFEMLIPSTPYVMCVLCYDANNLHGKLVKLPFETPSDVNQPEIIVSDVQRILPFKVTLDYSFSTQCAGYYELIYTTDEYSTFNDIETAYLINLFIELHLIEEKIPEDGSYYFSVDEEIPCMHLIAWAFDNQHNMSGKITNNFYNFQSSSAQRVSSQHPASHTKRQFLEYAKNNIKVLRHDTNND